MRVHSDSPPIMPYNPNPAIYRWMDEGPGTRHIGGHKIPDRKGIYKQKKLAKGNKQNTETMVVFVMIYISFVYLDCKLKNGVELSTLNYG